MIFLKATENDTETIQQLARKSWDSAYADLLSREQIEYMLAEMYSDEEISSQMKNPNYHYFLINEEQKNLGFFGFEHHYEPQTTKLHRIYLLEEAKGKGLGLEGMNLLKKLTKEVGDNRIILNVNKDNKARNFYEKLDFSVYGDGVFDIGNGFVMDDYLMECKL